MKWWIGWLILIVLIIGSRWIFTGRWQHNSLRTGAIADQTVDCSTGPISADIETAEASAETIFTKGFTQVLTAEADGCYRLNQTLPLYSITRTAKSRMIYRKRLWGPVTVTMIISVPFGQLEPPRQQYALKKFGPNARSKHYSLVTLAAAPPRRPQPPPHFPAEHPQAALLPLSEAVKMVASTEAWGLTFDGTSDFKGVPKEKLIRIAAEAMSPQIIDTEDQYDDALLKSEIAKLPTDKPMVIFAERDVDGRGYNLATYLATQGRKNIYWFSTGLKPPLMLPKQVPHLTTVDCWKALQLMASGVGYGFRQKKPGTKALWLARNELDLGYLKAIQPSLNAKDADYWFPGGNEQILWCQNHDLSPEFESYEDI